MGTNYHYEWTDGDTLFKPTSMNMAWSEIDKAITYLKSVIIHTDGDITYSTITGQLSWSSTIRILFNREDGDIIENIISTGSKILNDGQMCYVDLNETDGTALTMQTATITYVSISSQTMAYNRLVLGYRNSVSDFLFNYFIKINPDNYTQEV